MPRNLLRNRICRCPDSHFHVGAVTIPHRVPYSRLIPRTERNRGGRIIARGHSAYAQLHQTQNPKQSEMNEVAPSHVGSRGHSSPPPRRASERSLQNAAELASSVGTPAASVGLERVREPIWARGTIARPIFPVHRPRDTESGMRNSAPRVLAPSLASANRNAVLMRSRSGTQTNSRRQSLDGTVSSGPPFGHRASFSRSITSLPSSVAPINARQLPNNQGSSTSVNSLFVPVTDLTSSKSTGTDLDVSKSNDNTLLNSFYKHTKWTHLVIISR
jgi:hypothetical protein